MNRLVLAILILIAVLGGLQVVNTSAFRQWIANRTGGTPPTQTTGFNTNAPKDVTQDTPLVPTLPQQPSTPSPDNGGSGQNNQTPTEPLRPIPGGW